MTCRPRWFRRGTPATPIGAASGAASPATPALRAAALQGEADAARDAGRAEDAARLYEAMLQVQPWRTDIRVQWGNMLKDAGHAPLAEAAYRQALAESSDDADIHIQLGHVLKMMGRRPAALDAYRRALDADPHAAAALQELAEAGDAAAARRRFEVQSRDGGAAALLRVADQVERLRDELDRLARDLPDARARLAYPVELYDRYRAENDVPPPPGGYEARRLAVLLPVDDQDLSVLYEQLAAYARQAGDWRVLAYGTQGDRAEAVRRAAARENRIVWIDRGEPPHARPNDAAWLLLPAPGAVPHPQALAWLAAAAAWTGAAAFVTDAEWEAEGVLHPLMRRPVDGHTLRETNPYGETIAVRRDAYEAHAALAGNRGALLRALCAAGPVGHLPLPLFRLPRPESAAPHDDAVEAAGDAVIDIVIPTRDNAEDVSGFVRSLRDRAAQPGRFRITVLDNGGTDPASVGALNALAETGLIALRRIDEPFNWSRLNNLAAGSSDADILIFANDDMRMRSPGWDDTVRRLLRRPGVGAVGATLLYEDDTIQHAGVLFGWRGSVIHDGLNEDASDPGPAARWATTRAVGAVTGAFLATPRALFAAQGGFDDILLPVAYSDIDYALKLRAAGLAVLTTPAIVLTHYESKTRGADHRSPAKAARNAAERAAMDARWGAAMACDPGLHPAWRMPGTPFRWLEPPSMDALRRYIVGTASPTLWHVVSAG